MEYAALKHIHMTFVALTFLSFSTRAFWMLTESAMLQKKWVKIAPHIIDTLLLVSALAMAVQIGLTGWIAAKVAGLIAYILLGTIALKRGKTKQTRIFALLGAYAVFFYIAGVAVTKNPWLF
ncbi:MAG: SirB2 family protein [Hahellaceae bacterium]|nr:SirB2 family protein [Hahellaceae bacterium]